MSSTQAWLPLHTIAPPCALLTLSTELILQIIHFTPPESHLDFSLTCLQILACSSDILRRHQTAHAKYRVTSDLDPATIPTLLRIAAKSGPDDWIELWHVRSIEIWRDRASWDEWKKYSFDTPIHEDSASEVREWKWRDGEIVGYLDGLGDRLDEEEYEKADTEMRVGRDGLLKCLAIGMCPRLRDLRFVTQEHDEGSCLWWLKTVVDRFLVGEPQAPAQFEFWEFGEDEDVGEDGDFEDEAEDEGEENESEDDEEFEEADVESLELESLSSNEDDEDLENKKTHQVSAAKQASSLTREKAAHAYRSILSEYWPPGLYSLLNLAVGVPSSTWLDIRSDTPSAQIFCSLIRLPNITSLYYANLQHVRDDPIDYTLILPAACSSLRHLFLDNCDGDRISNTFIAALTHAPRNLVTAAFRSGDAHLEDSDCFVSCLALYQSASLESLMFYDYEGGSIHGYRCRAYKPEEFDRCRVIKQLSISIEDIELGCLYEGSDQKIEDAEFYVGYASSCFPASLETLVLWDEPGSGHCVEKRGETEMFERAVVKMIEDSNKECKDGDEDEQGGTNDEKEKAEKTEKERGWNPDTTYSNLKAIYVEEIESRHHRHHRNASQPLRTALGFQDAIAAGKKGGVDVHTLTNRNEMVHEISFPEAPDMYSLESGPHWETRPRDWVFNPYTGRRVPKGCGVCGACEKCLSEYPKELWDSLEKADVEVVEE